MKLFIYSLLFLLLAACSVQQTMEKKSADATQPMGDSITALLKDSRKTNSSPVVGKLVDAILKDPTNPEAFYSLGYVHMQNAQTTKNAHEHDLAISYFNYVLTILPGNQSVLHALYNMYYDDTLHNRNSDAFDNAIKVFYQLQESVRTTLNPPSMAKYVYTAIKQENERQPNHQELREILLKAIKEQPQNDKVYVQLAKIYTDDRYFSLAIATLKLGAENIENSVDLFKAIAETYERRAEVNGCNYEHMSDLVNASKYYKLAIPLTPENKMLHYNLSLLFIDQNLKQLALNESNISLTLDNSPVNISSVAQNYSMLGYNQKANEYLQLAMDKGFTESDGGYHEILMNQGDWQKAAKGFSAYIKTRENYNVYDLIKSDIIAQQLNQSSDQSLGQKAWITNKKITLNNTWEENLFKYWNSKISSDDLKKVALTSCEKTEYYFYTGYHDYQAGQIAQAKTKFNAALNQNTYRFIERPLARYFLQK